MSSSFPRSNSESYSLCDLAIPDDPLQFLNHSRRNEHFHQRFFLPIRSCLRGRSAGTPTHSLFGLASHFGNSSCWHIGFGLTISCGVQNDNEANHVSIRTLGTRVRACPGVRYYFVSKGARASSYQAAQRSPGLSRQAGSDRKIELTSICRNKRR